MAHPVPERVALGQWLGEVEVEEDLEPEGEVVGVEVPEGQWDTVLDTEVVVD